MLDSAGLLLISRASIINLTYKSKGHFHWNLARQVTVSNPL